MASTAATTAVTFTAGWGAVTTLVGTFAGALVTGLLGSWNERRRAREGHLAAHQARLLETRLATYADLRRRYLDYRRLSTVAVDTADAFAADEDGRPSWRGLEAQEDVMASAEAAHAAHQRFDEALADAEAVASSAVEQAIDAVRRCLEDPALVASADDLQPQAVAVTGGVEPARLPQEQRAEARSKLDDAEARLRAAIRAELRLDD